LRAQEDASLNGTNLNWTRYGRVEESDVAVERVTVGGDAADGDVTVNLQCAAVVAVAGYAVELMRNTKKNSNV